MERFCLRKAMDLLADRIDFGSSLRPLCGGQKELPLRVVSELMAEYAKAAGGVAEPSCGFDRGEPFDKKSAQSLVVPMGGIGGFKEGPC